MSSDWIFFPCFFGTISWVIWVVANGWQRRQHTRLIVEFNNRVLERLGSMREFSDFLHSEGGERLMRVLTSERGSSGPRERILAAVQSGIVVGSVGLGLMFLAGRIGGDAHEVLTILSAIVLSLGIGLMLSSAASFWVAKNLGMFEAQ